MVVDDREAAARAVRHLIAHGHRRIAFIGDGPDMDTARLRLEGYRDALAEAGIGEEPCWNAGGTTTPGTPPRTPCGC